jgi:hypothetical protein
MSPGPGSQEEALVRNPIEGNEGSGVLRVFGAVAALVALYGVSLSAVALIDPPRETREANVKPVVWYGPVTTAMELRRTLSTGTPVRGGSFWTSSATSLEALPAGTTVGTATGPSFWHERDANQAVNGSKLAGDLDRIHGSM